MKVVDPHIHLWDTQQPFWAWLANPGESYSGDARLMPKRHDVAALLRSAGSDVTVEMSVNVEAIPSDPVGEAKWLQALADDPANHGHPHGIVAHADLSRPDAAALLEKLSECRNLRGIRQILNVHSDAHYNYVGTHYMQSQQWRDNLRELARRGWSFDMQLYPSQAPAAVEIIRANPDVPFIINHGGMFVDRNSVAGWRQWRDGLRQLAACDNVAVKVSGFAMFDHRWTVESFRPYVLETIDAFGVDRSMFASNFPVDGLHASYAELWKAYADIVSGVSAAEQDKLFRANAKRYYRLTAV